MRALRGYIPGLSRSFFYPKPPPAGVSLFGRCEPPFRLMLLVAGPRHRLISAESEVRDRLVRPKNCGPDQFAPVIRSAIIVSER